MFLISKGSFTPQNVIIILSLYMTGLNYKDLAAHILRAKLGKEGWEPSTDSVHTFP